MAAEGLADPALEGDPSAAVDGVHLVVGRVLQAWQLEAFELAEGLGRVRPAMHHPEPQVQQPDGEGGEGVGAVMTLGRAIVHQHCGGQAVGPEDGGEVALDGLPLLIVARPHAEREPGVVIQHRQGMTATTAAEGEMARP